jgi:hypothetical protein
LREFCAQVVIDATALHDAKVKQSAIKNDGETDAGGTNCS